MDKQDFHIPNPELTKTEATNHARMVGEFMNSSPAVPSDKTLLAFEDNGQPNQIIRRPYLQGRATKQEIQNNKPSSDPPPLRAEQALIDQPDVDPKRAQAEIEDLVNQVGKSSPDCEEDELLKVEWQEWHERVHNSIRKLVDALVSREDNQIVDHREFKNNQFITYLKPKVTLPAMSTVGVLLTVDNERHILNCQIVKPSGSAEFDQLLLKATLLLDGKEILGFPKKSQRTQVSNVYGLSDHAQNGPLIYGDTEQIRLKHKSAE